MKREFLLGDNLPALRALPDNSIDSCVTDPPYGLNKMPDIATVLRDWIDPDKGYHEIKGSGFMSKKWDASVPQPIVWREVYRVLKPGGHVLSFAGTRTYDLMGLSIRIAGFEIRDSIRYLADLHFPAWVYAQGFPKSMDISKAIDKAAGAQRPVVGKAPGRNQPAKSGHHGGSTGEYVKGEERFTPDLTEPATELAELWNGWGTALKPAWEPIVVARKPLDGTMANNIAKWGVGGLNIDACRVEANDGENGWWPANLIHDGSSEVVREFPFSAGQLRAVTGLENCPSFGGPIFSKMDGQRPTSVPRKGKGSASRFFWSPKASTSEREAGLAEIEMREAGIKNASGRGFSERDPYANIQRRNHHPCIKPLAVMRYLCRLVTPPGGVVLDHYAGTASTLCAAKMDDFGYIGMEQEEDYFEIGEARLKYYSRQLSLFAANS